MGRIRLQSAAVITIAVPVMLAVAAPCSATSLTVLGALYGIQGGTGTTLFEQDLFFSAPRFDPSLGTLDSMLLTLIRGAVNVSITVDSESPFSALVAQDSVTAVANTKITYAGGTLASASEAVNIGPSPGVFLPPDSDGLPDFAGSDALTFSGTITGDTINQTIVDPSTLTDFTGFASVLLALTISELGGGTIPGTQAFLATYGEGIGAIGLTYGFTPAGPGPAPVPEPGTLTLIGSCAAFAVRAIGRRRSGQPPL